MVHLYIVGTDNQQLIYVIDADVKTQKNDMKNIVKKKELIS